MKSILFTCEILEKSGKPGLCGEPSVSLIRCVSGAIINKYIPGQAKLPVYCVSNRSCSLNFCQYGVFVGENEFDRAGFYMLF